MEKHVEEELRNEIKMLKLRLDKLEKQLNEIRKIAYEALEHATML
ncbi:MAG: hypothetical protein QXZ25_01060 [Candidatus Bathyarchaeia archaeon]